MRLGLLRHAVLYGGEAVFVFLFHHYSSALTYVFYPVSEPHHSVGLGPLFKKDGHGLALVQRTY